MGIYLQKFGEEEGEVKATVTVTWGKRGLLGCVSDCRECVLVD